MTIWAFGDSFIGDFKNLNYKSEQKKRGIKPWIRAIGEQLNQSVVNHGCPGSSPDYTYHMFRQERDNIQDNDILIVGISNLFRRWFIKDKPNNTMLNNKKSISEQHTSAEFMKAVKYYLIHLNHEELYETYCIDFLYNLDHLTKEKNLHTILLPLMYYEYEWLNTDYRYKFNNFHWPNMPLTNVHSNEYEKWYFERIHDIIGMDGKYNHLTWTNHAILTNKIVNNISYKIPLDFKTEFVEGIITHKTIQSPKFIEREFAAAPDFG